jgi:hypothetical protein
LFDDPLISIRLLEAKKVQKEEQFMNLKRESDTEIKFEGENAQLLHELKALIKDCGISQTTLEEVFMKVCFIIG